MRSYTLVVAGVFVGCGGGAQPQEVPTGEAQAAPPAAAAKPAAPVAPAPVPAPAAIAQADDHLPDGENIVEEMREMNGDTYARPPASFRKGHVSPRKAPKVVTTRTGFEVQFASHASVVTPAVHQGKVFVSGGFQSKEFHAFDAKSGKAAWSVNLDDDGPSASACEDGVCVFNTESCTVFALDAATGKQRWSWWLGDPLTSAPTIAGGRVFTSYPAAGTAGGKKPRPPKATHALAAIDLKSGEIVWQQWLDADVMSAPVAQGEFVYVTTFAGAVMKLEQATGKIRYAIRARATSAPVVMFAKDGRESMYYTRRGVKEADGAEEMIIRADDNDPKTTFSVKSKKAHYLDEKVQHDADYAKQSAASDAANGFGGAEAPAAANAKAAVGTVGAGRVASMQAFQGSRILHLGDRNVNTMGDEVVATSAKDGATLWSKKLDGDARKAGGFLGTAPLAAGKSVLYATLDGAIVELDPSSGAEKARYQVGRPVRSQPVVEGGWIYVGTEDGRLVAIDTGKRDLTGWAMWGGNAARTGIALR
jgi:outer membrane protein assembly factor BamB